jgi:hypothetical protein
MKATVVCFMILLTGACRQAIDGSPSVNTETGLTRNERLDKAVNTYCKTGNPHYIQRDFEFRGPLTVTQVDDELRRSHETSSQIRKEVYGTTEKFEDSHTAWTQLKATYRTGDELYFFMGSDRRTWTGEILGYVLVRNKAVVGMMVTAIS